MELTRPLGGLGGNNRPMVLTVAIIAAVITAITSVVLTRGSASSGGVTVPAVTGEHVTAATSDLEAAGLSPLVVRSASTTVDADIVIRQAPSPGQTVDRGSVVEILVSAGRLGALGDLAGRPPGSANLGIETIGFQVESDTENIMTSIPGTVSWSPHRLTWSAHPR
jgi:beta-lactam-binding protein with PASTA domain